MTYRPLILFVCTGNTCRSAMAERLFLHLLQAHGDEERFRTASAGVWAHAGRPAAAEAVALLASQGLDLSQHRSRPLTQQLVDEADVLLVMERAHLEDLTLRFSRTRGKTYLLSSVTGERKDLTDPISLGEEAYAACYETLLAYLTEGYQHIVAMAEGASAPAKPRKRWPWQRR